MWGSGLRVGADHEDRNPNQLFVFAGDEHGHHDVAVFQRIETIADAVLFALSNHGRQHCRTPVDVHGMIHFFTTSLSKGSTSVCSVIAG